MIVRATAHYCNAAGEPAPGAPRATYEFAYSALQPTVGMRATISQRDGPDWQQVHVFEMYHKTEQPFFDTVAWSPPLQSIPFVDEAKTHSLGSSAWGALLTDEVALALLGPDLYGIHTNLTGHGVYVHGPWHTFRDGAYSFEATLYLGPSGGSARRWPNARRAGRGLGGVRAPAAAREADRAGAGGHRRRGAADR